MATTQILAFAKQEDAQAKARFYGKDHQVLIIGPTDQIVLAKEKEDGVAWRSGAGDDFYLMIATPDKIVGPGKLDT